MPSAGGRMWHAGPRSLLSALTRMYIYNRNIKKIPNTYDTYDT